MIFMWIVFWCECVGFLKVGGNIDQYTVQTKGDESSPLAFEHLMNSQITIKEGEFLNATKI